MKDTLVKGVNKAAMGWQGTGHDNVRRPDYNGSCSGRVQTPCPRWC